MNYGREGIRKQQMAINARGPKWARKLLLLFVEILLFAVIGVGIVVAAFGIGVFKSILANAPDVTNVAITPTGQSSFVYDNQGNQVDKLVSANANRIIVKSEQIPDNLKHALVAIEDERFYQHNGIDIQGIMRAALKAAKSGHLSQGASTITQQLLKNNVFTEWMSEENDVQKIKRKIQEQYLAVQLEKERDKDEILTAYLNTINLGQNTLGVQSASLRYYGKDVSELTLSECAVLAAITQNPSYYNPIIHPENNFKRTQEVLKKMYELGYISASERQQALADNVYDRISSHNIESGESAVTTYFTDALIDEVVEDLTNAGYSDNEVYSMLYSGGLKIYSTMDPDIQKIVDEEVSNPDNYSVADKWLLDYRLTVLKADGTYENHSAEMFKRYFKKKNSNFNMLYKTQEAAYEDIETYQAAVLEEGDEVFMESVEITLQPQISVTVADQHTGYVVAMAGGRGDKIGSRTFNRATGAKRQPGSCFKVLSAFAPALDAGGLTLATVFNDAPFNYYDGTKVSNWYGADTYKGLCTIRYGIAYSLNVVAVKTLTQITPQLGFNYLLNFGFTTLQEAEVIGDKIYTDIGQPLALGGITYGVYNIELNSAYATIANGGTYIKPKLYTKITDSKGNVILDNTAPVTRDVIKPQTAFLMTSAMEDVLSSIGTAPGAKLKGMHAAGKTGTTSNSQDVWFSGFTPYYTATIWSGYDNNAELIGNEANYPKVLFRQIMNRVHADLPDKDWNVPPHIVRCEVCSESGKLPVAGLCDGHIREEYFTEDTVPEEFCDIHYLGNVCGYDNLLACEGCPFAYYGVATLPLVEDSSLWGGSTVIVTDELDPLNATVVHSATTTNSCHHDAAFFSQENWEAILAQEQAEYAARVAAAQAAADASAAGQ